MSSIWKTTGLGGGCASATLFCCACVCNGSSMAVHKEGVGRCSVCAKLDLERCYCHPVNDTKQLEELRKLLNGCAVEAVDAGCARPDRTQQESNLLIDPLQADRIENRLHIDFEPQDRNKRSSFSRLVRQELELRLIDGPTPAGSVTR